MKKMVRQFFSDESGASLTEYALLVALIAIVVIGVLTTMGGQIQAVFQAVVDALAGAIG